MSVEWVEWGSEDDGVDDLHVRIFHLVEKGRRRELWSLFAPYHYLSPSLFSSAASFMATLDGGEPVAFTSAISMPSGTLVGAWREHRTVVLPDYQGFGLGLRLVEWSAEWHLARGRRFYSRTTHPRIGLARDASPLWRATKKSRVMRNPEWSNASDADTVRLAFSHEYMGAGAGAGAGS